jgi:hypothetical protein
MTREYVHDSRRFLHFEWKDTLNTHTLNTLNTFCSVLQRGVNSQKKNALTYVTYECCNKTIPLSFRFWHFLFIVVYSFICVWKYRNGVPKLTSMRRGSSLFKFAMQVLFVFRICFQNLETHIIVDSNCPDDETCQKENKLWICYQYEEPFGSLCEHKSLLAFFHWSDVVLPLLLVLY